MNQIYSLAPRVLSYEYLVENAYRYQCTMFDKANSKRPKSAFHVANYRCTNTTTASHDDAKYMHVRFVGDSFGGCVYRECQGFFRVISEASVP